MKMNASIYKVFLILLCSLMFQSLSAAAVPSKSLNQSPAQLPDHLPDYIRATVNSQNISTGKILLRAPDVAENGAVVPIAINEITLDNKNTRVEEVWFFNERRTDAVAHYNIGERGIAEDLATRFKLAKSGYIYAVARLSDGAMISGRKEIKVVTEGCGG